MAAAGAGGARAAAPAAAAAATMGAAAGQYGESGDQKGPPAGNQKPIAGADREAAAAPPGAQPRHARARAGSWTRSVGRVWAARAAGAASPQGWCCTGGRTLKVSGCQRRTPARRAARALGPDGALPPPARAAAPRARAPRHSCHPVNARCLTRGRGCAGCARDAPAAPWHRGRGAAGDGAAGGRGRAGRARGQPLGGAAQARHGARCARACLFGKGEVQRRARVARARALAAQRRREQAPGAAAKAGAGGGGAASAGQPRYPLRPEPHPPISPRLCRDHRRACTLHTI